MSRLQFKAIFASAFLLAPFAANAAVVGGISAPSSGARDSHLVQYYGADPRRTCQDAGGRYWRIPQTRVQVSEARPVGPGTFEMTIWGDGRQAVCVADTNGQVRRFSEMSGSYGPGYGPNSGPGYGYGSANPATTCQDAAGRYWRVPQVRVGVSDVRPAGGGTTQVTVSYGGRVAICVTDPSGGQVLSFNDR